MHVLGKPEREAGGVFTIIMVRISAKIGKGYRLKSNRTSEWEKILWIKPMMLLIWSCAALYNSNGRILGMLDILSSWCISIYQPACHHCILQWIQWILPLWLLNRTSMGNQAFYTPGNMLDIQNLLDILDPRNWLQERSYINSPPVLFIFSHFFIP